MKINLLILLTLGVFTFTSCKKSSGGNPSGTSSSNSYFPVSAGSTWKYAEVGLAGNDSLTIRTTGATAIFNGKTYYTATSVYKVKGSSVGYFYAANHGFAVRATSSAAGVTLELQMYNDTVAVGHSWTTIPTDNGYVNGVQARTVNTIVEKDITKKIGTKTFTNVVHTKIDLQYNIGGFESFSVYDVYLAKGVGMIELDSNIFGTDFDKETIVDYSIK